MSIIQNPTLGEKIKLLREAAGFSQAKLAKALYSSTMLISRIERDLAACDDEMLHTIKKTLGVENAPLLESELTAYKSRLVALFDMIEGDNLIAAQASMDTLFAITDLPWEYDLSIMYSSLKTMLEVLAKTVTARQALGADEFITIGADNYLDNASSKEALYMYHLTKGLIYYYKSDDVNAIEHLTKLFDNPNNYFTPDAKILTFIGTCYIFLLKPVKAMLWLERARAIYNYSRASRVGPLMNQMLGLCYITTGEYKLAKELHETGLAQARSVNDEIRIAEELINLAVVSEGMGDLEKSVRLSDQALSHINKDQTPVHYLSAITNKAKFLYRLKKHEKARELLDYGKTLSYIDSSLAILLEALSHLLTLKNSESIDYLENVAIPHFRTSISYIHMALDICRLLEDHYKRTRSAKKALLMASTIRDIYEDMFIGESNYV